MTDKRLLVKTAATWINGDEPDKLKQAALANFLLDVIKVEAIREERLYKIKRNVFCPPGAKKLHDCGVKVVRVCVLTFILYSKVWTVEIPAPFFSIVLFVTFFCWANWDKMEWGPWSEMEWYVRRTFKASVLSAAYPGICWRFPKLITCKIKIRVSDMIRQVRSRIYQICDLNDCKVLAIRM